MKSGPRCKLCGKPADPLPLDPSDRLCVGCREKRGRKTSCHDCGRSMYAKDEGVPVLCAPCVKNRSLDGRACIRCGRSCESGSRWWKDNPYCRPCGKHAHEPKECFYCGEQKTRLHRAKAQGLTEPACPACIIGSLPLCTCCKTRTHKPTKEINGKLVCEPCVQKMQNGPEKCDRCGRTSVLANSRFCKQCRANSHAHHSVEKLRGTLSTPWGKELLAELYQLCGGKDRATSSLARIAANIDGIRAVESNFQGPEDLSARRLFELLVPEGNHKANIALRRLIETRYGISTNNKDMQDVCLERFIAARHREQPPWIVETGNGFMSRLKDLRDKQLAAGVTRGSTPVAWKSQELAFRYANDLMIEVSARGGSSAQAISQADVDLFCTRRSRVFRGLGAFISHLNETSHRAVRLQLPKTPGSRSSRANFIGQSAYDELVERLLSEESPLDARNASIALLSLLYLRKVKDILLLRRHQVADDGVRMTIEFTGAKGEEEIHPSVAALLRLWLANWKMHSRSVNESNTPFVFPGLSPGQPMRPTAFNSWIKTRHGVLSRQLLASGIHVMINAGMATPTALIDHYGLSHSTAIKYWTDSGRELSQFMYSNTTAVAGIRGR